jgi:hypothetical protein
MTGSILTATDLSQRCPRCGNALLSGALVCPDCGGNFAEKTTRRDGFTASASVEEIDSSTQLSDAAAPGSKWGPASNAALSLSVFVLVFGASALFERRTSDGESRQVVHRVALGAMADNAVHDRPHPSATKGYQIAVAPKRTGLDAALARARACDIQESWTCVTNAARDALALDGGNMEAQALLQRSITQSARQNPMPRTSTSPAQSSRVMLQ